MNNEIIFNIYNCNHYLFYPILLIYNFQGYIELYDQSNERPRLTSKIARTVSN